MITKFFFAIGFLKILFSKLEYLHNLILTKTVKTENMTA